MKENFFVFSKVSLISYVVGILTLILIYFVFSGKRIPLIGDGKAAFVVLWILGLSMSILGGTRDYPDGKFTLPSTLLYLLMLLGVLAIALLPVMLFGVKIPLVTTYREAFIVLGIIIIAKWAVVHLFKLYNLLI